MRPEPFLPRDLDIRKYLLKLKPHLRNRAIESFGPEARDTYDRAWSEWAHEGQREPDAASDWSTWVIMAGRGFGKTLAGANWVTALIAAHEGVPLRIALVGATIEDARRVMVEGRSGLIEVAARWLTDWEPSLGRLTFSTGASAQIFSGASPDRLRGPEHHYAWCDELAKWEKPRESWDMLQLGLRLGPHPRALVTTTPRPGPVLSSIMEEPGTQKTGGPTSANPHLPRAWQQRVARLYAGTRLGRQELGGELLTDTPGALWTVELIEKCRLKDPPRDGEGDRPQDGGGGPTQANPQGAYTRTLIAVDPPAVDGTCGIIACARQGAGHEAIAHVLADHSVTGRSPEGWAGAVAAAAKAHGTIEVVAESNQGGKMVKSVFHTADPNLRVKLVNAAAGKSTRAEPVAHLFEAGRAFFHRRMPELEAQLLGLIAGGGYEGPGPSPDRADAMVWGLTELILDQKAAPKVWLV